MISVFTLDSLIDSQVGFTEPILVKMDIQGYEVNALRGASKLLSTPHIIISEFWPYGLEISGSSVDEYADLIEAYSLSVYEVPLDRAILKKVNMRELGSRLTGNKYCDIVITNMPIEQTGLARFQSLEK